MQLPAYIIRLLEDIAHDEGFQKYELIVESGSSHGENIHGVLASIKVIGERGASDKHTNVETLHLMCKMAPVSKECRDSFQSALLFKREIYLYTHVLPAFVEFQLEKGFSEADSFLTFPKVYATYADDEQECYAIIMEDMRTQKFVLWPRHSAISLDHERIVLGKLAKLHGVSLAMKDQRPTIFNAFKELPDVADTQIELGNFGNVLENALQQGINVLASEDHKEILQTCKSNYREILKKCFAKDATERFGVINHGDCWTNNCLFKNAEDTHEVMDVCLVDWQLSRYSSPAPDLLYQIFASTRKQMRDQSYTDLIKYYYAVLSDTITKLGSDPNVLFRFTDLENELRASGGFILIMGTLVIQYALAQANDLRNIDEYCEQLANRINDSNNNAAPSLLKSISEKTDPRIAAINDLVGDVIAYGFHLPE